MRDDQYLTSSFDSPQLLHYEVVNQVIIQVVFGLIEHYELKWDGFRAVAYVESGACRLVSRNGRAFKTFAESIAGAVGQHQAILDGETVALDAAGRAQFYPLLYRRAEPYFYAFDCMWLDGRDLRGLALVERKRIVRGLVPCQPPRLLYVDHVVGNRVELFREVCRQDMEGIVAKKRDGVYEPAALTWVKIKNRQYSQSVGRHERFERMRAGHDGRAREVRDWPKGGSMRFAPYDDAEVFELRLNRDREGNYIPEPGDKDWVQQNAINTMRLWDYLRAHADDAVVNAGAIAKDLGWPRADVFLYLEFLLMGGFVECARSRELVVAMSQIESGSARFKNWLTDQRG